MEIYLPVAELAVGSLLILGMGASVGFLSGLFGIGGGFLLTPLLIFSGIPPAVAVATVNLQIVASSTSGALTYLRRNMLDLKLATVLLIGGVTGSFFGVWVFTILRDLGQLDAIISLSYVTFLGSIGTLMFVESIGAIMRARSGQPARVKRPGQHNWIHGLPFKMRFKRSKIYISVIPVLVLGGFIGFLGSLLGIGGGFIMVPALIYLLRVPTSVVIGTSLVQILATMAAATFLHAITSQTLDVILGILLVIGGVVGAQFGAQFGQKIKAEQLRLLLAVLVLAVGSRFVFDLLIMPEELFSLNILGVTR
jgi:hypothetical protein